MKVLDPSGNNSRATQYFPVRLPHALRAKLDEARKLTGLPRSYFLIAGAEAKVAEVLEENSEAQRAPATGLLSTGSN